MGVAFPAQSLKDFVGEAKLKKFISFVLHYIADLVSVDRCSWPSR